MSAVWYSTALHESAHNTMTPSTAYASFVEMPIQRVLWRQNSIPREGKNEDVQKRAREMAAIAAEAKRVADVLAEVPSSFCGTLDYHIKRRGYTNEKMEERTGISSRMIQDYRKKKDSNITLQSVLAFASDWISNRLSLMI